MPARRWSRASVSYKAVSGTGDVPPLSDSPVPRAARPLLGDCDSQPLPDVAAIPTTAFLESARPSRHSPRRPELQFYPDARNHAIAQARVVGFTVPDRRALVYAARGVRRRASRCCVSSVPLGIAPTDLAPLQPGEAIVASRLLVRGAALAEDGSTPVFLLARVFAADDDAGVGAFVRPRSSFAGMVGPPGRLVCSRISSARARKAIRLWPGY